jgi:hypothetical protein
MNRNLKIVIGVAVGVGLIYLGYKFLYKKDGKKSVGTAPLGEEIVYDKNTRRVVEVINE